MVDHIEKYHDVLRLNQLTEKLLLCHTPQTVASVVLNFASNELNRTSSAILLLGPDRKYDLVKSQGEPSFNLQEFESLVGTPQVSRQVSRQNNPSLARVDYLVFGGHTIGAFLSRGGKLSTVKEELFDRFINMISISLEASLAIERRLNKRVTDAKKQENESSSALSSQMRETIEKQHRFLLRISHEIRTPLNSIIGITDLLASSPECVSISDKIEAISRSGSSLLHLINDVLDVSKIKSGQLQLDLHEFDLIVLVEDVINMFHHRKSDEVRLCLEIEDGLYPKRVGDSYKLKQVLVNLVGNAMKFTNEGSVTLRLSHSGSSIHFSVADTGIGLSDEDKKTVFTEFYQSKRSVKQKVWGSGLGLAIAQNIVKMMGGVISISNNLLAKSGTIFSFEIRLTMAKSICQRQAIVDCESSIVDEKKAVLVADDCPENIFLMRALLNGTSFETTYVENGEQAKDVFSSQHFDLVILDIQMPELDGIQAAKAIREIESEHGRKSCPIIALTADAYENDEERLKKQGFNAKLTKPIRQKELLAAFSKVLVRTRAKEHCF